MIMFPPYEFKNKLLMGKAPRNCTVTGSMVIDRTTPCTSLPRGLSVHGSLEIRDNNNITHLPTGMRILEALVLTRCNALTSLPNGLCVEGSLYISGCYNLTSFYRAQVLGKVHIDENLLNRIPKEDLPLYMNFEFSTYISERYRKRIAGM